MLPSSDEQIFGELRSLMHQAPSLGVWAKLCALLDRLADSPIAAQALDYARDHLRRWPDALRVAPLAWRREVLSQLPDVSRLPLGWPLVRALHLDAEDLDDPERSPDPLLWLFGDDALTQSLTHLHLEECHLTDEHVQALCIASCAEHLTHLVLRHNDFGEEGVQAIVQARHMRQLETLDLRGNNWGGYEEAIPRLANAPHLRHLRQLDIECDLTHEGLSRLFTSPHMGRIEHLGLIACVTEHAYLGAEEAIGITALSQVAMQLTALRSLDLSNNLIEDEQLDALLEIPWLPQLDALRLDWNEFGDEGAIRLSECEALQGLTALGLRGCHIGERGARALLGSPHLARLTRLDISSSEGLSVADDASERPPRLLGINASSHFWIEALLSRSPHCAAMRALNLSDLYLEASLEDLRALHQHPCYRAVEHLELANTDLDPALLALLFDAERFLPRLHVLNLNRNYELGDALAMHLPLAARSGLRHLELRECGLEDRHLDALLAAVARLDTLESLDLRGNTFSARAVRRLDALSLSHPCHVSCDVDTLDPSYG